MGTLYIAYVMVDLVMDIVQTMMGTYTFALSCYQNYQKLSKMIKPVWLIIFRKRFKTNEKRIIVFGQDMRRNSRNFRATHSGGRIGRLIY